MTVISLQEVKAAVFYDPETGIFSWPASLKNQWAGQSAGTLEKKGYLQITVNGRRFKAHRLAWFYMTGQWPKHQIDHVNGAKADNRFRNLREATNAENKRNAKRRADNTSGYKCVHWAKAVNKWAVAVKFPGAKLQTKCGYFANLADAVRCANYNIAFSHGAFAVLNPICEPMEGIAV